MTAGVRTADPDAFVRRGRPTGMSRKVALALLLAGFAAGVFLLSIALVAG